MTETKNRELIIRPKMPESNLAAFLEKIKTKGVDTVLTEPRLASAAGLKSIYESNDADLVICKTIDQLKQTKSHSKIPGYLKKVMSNSDIEEIEAAALAGAQFVVVDASDWKIIPLENIIAKLHRSKTKVYTTANTATEVATMFSVLELGVDGVILATDSEEEIDRAKQQMGSIKFPIKPARIVEIKDVGTGERVCVDTASMMSIGEGMLVGSRSNFMLLVHNESVGSSFTSPRPFRVNAGAVYCYTITPDGKTHYLSELESGSEVWIVNAAGVSRKAVVGRSKIETRPLRLIRAEIEGQSGTAILQNAETIRLMTKDGKLLSVTELQVGDVVLGYSKPPSGRHFGMEVDEFIVEK